MIDPKLKLAAVALLCFAPLARANDPHYPPPPAKPVVIVEHDHDGAAVAALVGAGITFWIMRLRAKHHAVITAHGDCTTVTKDRERDRHIFEACSK